MEQTHFHHALKVMPELCTACSHCMRSCPTEAIRIRNGKANITGNKCIDCGECFRVCPSNAIYVEQDDFNAIYNYKYRVAIVPVVLTAQLSLLYSMDEIYSAFTNIGFTHIYEVENSAHILHQFQQEYIAQNKEFKPLISCFCPAIVRMIQVKFPSLTPHLITLKQPLDYAAMYCRKKLEDAGISEKEAGLFYITPCAAKIAAVKSPVGEEKSAVTGVINMDLLYNRIRRNITNNPGAKQNNIIPFERPSKIGYTWPLTKGEAKNINGRTVAIDGLKNALDFLEKIENEETSGFDFIEIRACDESCAGGILSSSNRFMVVEELEKEANAAKNEPKNIDQYIGFLHANKDIQPVEPRSIMQLDNDTAKALEKVQKIQKLMCFLPGFDCGVCGAPSCNALAEDIVQGQAHISHCLFMQRVMEQKHKLNPDHAYHIIEQIWGEKRLEKNCNKKGAK